MKVRCYSFKVFNLFCETLVQCSCFITFNMTCRYKTVLCNN